MTAPRSSPGARPPRPVPSIRHGSALASPALGALAKCSRVYIQQVDAYDPRQLVLLLLGAEPLHAAADQGRFKGTHDRNPVGRVLPWSSFQVALTPRLLRFVC